MQEEPEKISSPEEIRKVSAGEKIVKFPSGFYAKLRKFNLSDMLEKGLIPDDFFDFVETEQGKEISTKKYPQLMKVINGAMKEIFVEPQVVDENPAENQICVKDLSDEDKFFAFNWAMPKIEKKKNE